MGPVPAGMVLASTTTFFGPEGGDQRRVFVTKVSWNRRFRRLGGDASVRRLGLVLSRG